MADYPLLFRISHAVRCVDFEARVVIEGRVLMTREDGEWWCHGVEPGGLTENGDGPLVAYERFRISLRHALDDLAEEGGSFEAFRRDAQMLFSTDTAEEERWDAAVSALRVTAEKEIEEPFRDMERLAPRRSTIIIKPLMSYVSAPLSEASDAEPVALPLAA